jgi:lysophospholipase L1-like esterase
MKWIAGVLLAVVIFGAQATPVYAARQSDPPAPSTPSGRAGEVSSLPLAFDNVGISDNAEPEAADLDGAGRSLSEQALAAAGWRRGTRVTVDGTALVWPDVPPGEPDNVVANAQTITVGGRGRALSFLVTATGGEVEGRGTIVYAGGGRQAYTLRAADWVDGLSSIKTVALPYRNTADGRQDVPVKIYTVTVPLDPGRPLRSVTLPDAGPPGTALHVFALGIRPLGWSATWTTSAGGLQTVEPWTEQTRRMVVHTSTGGRLVRIRLENTFADRPVVIGRATIARQAVGAVPTGRPVPLTFGGRARVTIPAGGAAISDAAGFEVPADRNLLVSLYLPGPVEAAPLHSFESQTSYATPSGAGDHAADTEAGAFTETFGHWNLLTGVDVATGPGTIVALGNSITDGVGSTRDANQRWPNHLAARLLAQREVPHFGIANAGIGGNRVVADRYDGGGPSTDTRGVSALHRLERDVLAQPGARTVIVLQGINDLRNETTADELLAGLREVAERARAHGLRVLVGTLTPCKGWPDCTDAVEEKRRAVNAALRGPDAGGFDAVLDFDAVVRDPADPERFLPAYDSGDHLHPGDLGYRAMAESIDLSLLVPGRAADAA